MAAKSKKRLSKIENKLLKLDKLDLNDVSCSICQSILIEPVTLPCFHDFCKNCFNGSIENNALCCPLCRLRIGSWLRTNTKRRNLVNVELWKHIQKKFPKEIECKTKGEDVIIPEAKPILRLSAPGEIRSEYEAELKRLRRERLQLEEKHFEETELLIQKIQQEEEEAHKKYLEALQRDEMIAKQMQKELKCRIPSKSPKRPSLKSAKPRYTDRKIDGYLKHKPQFTESPLITDDNTSSTDNSTPKLPNKATNGNISPEMVPSYGNMIKNIIEKKNRIIPALWSKENTEKVKEIAKTNEKTKTIKKRLSSSETEEKHRNIKKKNNIPSLLVSLPLPSNSILHNKIVITDNRKETGSVDSMRQELCYFKPIDEITTTSFDSTKGLPVRVPGVRPTRVYKPPLDQPPPSNSQYIDSLCKLRSLSLDDNLPSAFIIAMSTLRVNRKPLSKCETNKSKSKKRSSISPCAIPSVPAKRNPARSKQTTQTPSKKIESNLQVRRTRSMSTITKEENETTPKKANNKGRKAASERKPYLRSDSKKYAEMSVSPLDYSKTLNNNKVSVVVKNLSSPLKNTDMKELLNEQLRIEKMIEQENSDFELARKIEAEWNGRRPRRATVKRQMTLNYALRPAKKLKV